MLNHEHFFNPKFKITNYKKKKLSPIKVYDKLFYTIYHKLNERKLILDKYNEVLEKIRVIEQLEHITLKQKNKILEDLQGPNIQLFTLKALTLVWNMNIVWYADYCYFEFIVNESQPIYYLSHNYEWTHNYEGTKYKINDIFKPIKSITYYKLDELKEIANYMNIHGKIKKDFYDQIVEYFKHIKLI